MLEFQLNNTTRKLLNSAVAVATVSGQYELDLRITCTSGEVNEGSGFNGKVKFELAGSQNSAEFEVDAMVESEGLIVIKSEFLAKLPDKDELIWTCKEVNNKLHVISQGFNYDFSLSEKESFFYDATYGQAAINLSSISSNLPVLSSVISGFVTKRLDNSIDGAVKISGEEACVYFEATNNKDAFYGIIDIPEQIHEPWQVLVPISQFITWKLLPIDLYPLLIHVSTDHQLTINCGPLWIVQNTLNNIIESMEPVKTFGENFFKVAIPDTEEHAALTFEFKYNPEVFQKKISDATIYAERDVTLHLTSKDSDKITIGVQTLAVDSDTVCDNNVEVSVQGSAKINKGSLLLVNKLKHLSSIKIDAEDKDSWLICRCLDSMAMIGTPDNKFVALTSQIAI